MESISDVGIFKAVIQELIEDDELGIYPQSFAGWYEKRTEFMEGWNKACIAQAKRNSRILREYGIQYHYEDDIKVIGPCNRKDRKDAK
jgi:hypothetical protein